MPERHRQGSCGWLDGCLRDLRRYHVETGVVTIESRRAIAMLKDRKIRVLARIDQIDALLLESLPLRGTELRELEERILGPEHPDPLLSHRSDGIG